MKKLLMLIVILISLSGCARMQLEGDFNGTAFGVTSKRSDFIVLSQSGGLIMDVWLMKDSMVKSPDGSDGWLFVDGDGVPTTVSGDAKVMRVKNPSMFEKYHEYHMEFESMTYRELYNK